MRKQWLEAGIDIRVSSHQEIAIYTNQTTQDSCERTPPLPQAEEAEGALSESRPV